MQNTGEVTIAQKVITMERVALDRWGKGDPSGFLEITEDDVSYFDPFQERRLDGLAALTVLYEQIRGKVRIDRAEVIDPRVQIIGDVGILTFQFVSQGSEGKMYWNSTEVYRCTGESWKIVHTHWSFTKPDREADTAN